MLCYAMLCYAMLCYAVLCCAVLCYEWRLAKPVVDLAIYRNAGGSQMISDALVEGSGSRQVWHTVTVTALPATPEVHGETDMLRRDNATR